MMNTLAARRYTLALVLGLSSFAAVPAGSAQSAKSTKTAQPSVITGTDPVPPSCGCKNSVAQPAPTAASTSSTGSMVQTLLAFFGLA